MGTLSAFEQQAEINSIYDGDTLTAIKDGQSIRIRLLYLDTPELKGNKHGPAMTEDKASADALKAMLPSGSNVLLSGPSTEMTLDHYGRVLAIVTKQGSETTIQEAMVLAGAPSFKVG